MKKGEVVMVLRVCLCDYGDFGTSRDRYGIAIFFVVSTRLAPITGYFGYGNLCVVMRRG